MKSIAASFAVLLVAAAAFAQAPGPVVEPRIAYLPGQPVGSSALRRPFAEYDNVTVSLELNRDKDRLGARVTACNHPLGYDIAGDCEDVLFAFPMVTVDKANKKVTAEGQTVVEMSRWKGVHTVKPWTLKMKSRPQTHDTGFDRVRYETVEVWLER